MYYPAAFIKHPDSNMYDVMFIDLLGCVSQGDDLEDAIRMAQEALGFHLTGMLKNKEELPHPSTLEEAKEKFERFMAEENVPVTGKEIHQYILADMPDMEIEEKTNPPVRLNISLREKLLAEVDVFAEDMGITRSGLISIATKDYIKRMSA